ncbi:MAG TPA: T9SS type A sorting domain-containing protein [Saprospiraceae bacterium]|nr:T9SS type A sorting domain-containing protein [Saprospiraceae bacterium]
MIPNPVQEWVTFSVEKGNLPIQSIEIYTLDGKQLFKSDYSSGQILQTIDTGNLDHGIYMYRIWVGDRPVTGKLVKM